MGTAPVKEGEGRPPVCNAAVAFRAVYGERARAMVVRSASITVPRNAPFSRTTTPRMVEPKGKHTSSFNWPGCLPDQHQLRRTQSRLRGNLLGLRALQPFGHAGVAAFAYYQRK